MAPGPDWAGRTPYSRGWVAFAGANFLFNPGQMSLLIQNVVLMENINPYISGYAPLSRITAVHLLEAGVELEVIGGWLGHASLDSTHRYAEIGMPTKIAAVERCLEPVAGKGREKAVGGWKKTPDLLDYLDSL